MIVRLTTNQWNSIHRRITPDLAAAMRDNRTSIGRSHDYRLPAIGWRRILDQLQASAYGPIGGATQGPDSLYRAISKIADKVSYLESHPALACRAIMGFSAERIPAWRMQAQGSIRTPYPMIDIPKVVWEFVILCPKHHIEGDRTITTWQPGRSDPSDPLEEPGFHLALAGAEHVAGQVGGRVDEVDSSGVEQA